jgi:uncharacterized protein
MKLYVTRLQRGQDLKRSLAAFAKEKNIQAGVLMSAVGCLTAVHFRLAGAKSDNQPVRHETGAFEIVSVTGTITAEDMHVHIGVADKSGVVIGGHIKDGCLVDTTAEIVILDGAPLRFVRKPDGQTGFDELTVEEA